MIRNPGGMEMIRSSVKSWMSIHGKACASAVVALAVIVLICGCSRSAKIAKDPVLARKLIDAVYAGSLKPMSNDVAPVLLRGMPDRALAGTSQVLRQRFGEVRGLTFQSSADTSPVLIETIWTVAAERGTYEMNLYFGKGPNPGGAGKVTGILFRFSPSEQWVPAERIGLAYLRQQRTPE